MGPGDLAHVDVALGVDADTVGSDEAAGGFPLGFATQAGQDVALGIVDGDAGAQVGGLEVGTDGHAQFPDVGALGGLVDVEAAGAGHVDPLGLEPAIGVEDLHTVVFAVGHEDPAVLVGADVVGDVEAPGVQYPMLPMRRDGCRPANTCGPGRCRSRRRRRSRRCGGRLPRGYSG